MLNVRTGDHVRRAPQPVLPEQAAPSQPRMQPTFTVGHLHVRLQGHALATPPRARFAQMLLPPRSLDDLWNCRIILGGLSLTAWTDGVERPHIPPCRFGQKQCLLVLVYYAAQGLDGVPDPCLDSASFPGREHVPWRWRGGRGDLGRLTVTPRWAPAESPREHQGRSR